MSLLAGLPPSTPGLEPPPHCKCGACCNLVALRYSGAAVSPLTALPAGKQRRPDLTDSNTKLVSRIKCGSEESNTPPLAVQAPGAAHSHDLPLLFTRPRAAPAAAHLSGVA
jgi:hypothetical protein